jgi:hypothetical protein
MYIFPKEFNQTNTLNNEAYTCLDEFGQLNPDCRVMPALTTNSRAQALEGQQTIKSFAAKFLKPLLNDNLDLNLLIHQREYTDTAPWQSYRKLYNNESNCGLMIDIIICKNTEMIDQTSKENIMDDEVKNKTIELTNFEELFRCTSSQRIKAFIHAEDTRINIYTNRYSWELLYAALYTLIMHCKNNPICYALKASSIDVLPEIPEILLALARRKHEQVEPLLNKMRNGAAKTFIIQNILKKAININAPEEIRGRKSTLQNLQNNIQAYLTNIVNAEKDIQRLQSEILGFTYRTDDMENIVEMAKYIERNHSILQVDACPSNVFSRDKKSQVVLFIQTPMNNFEEELAKRYVPRAMEAQGGRMNEEEKILQMEFVKALFVTQSFRLWTSIAFAFDFQTYDIADITNTFNWGQPMYSVLGGSTKRYFDSKEWNIYFPHPHITRIGCWGNHQTAIKSWLGNPNKTGVLDQIMSAAKNINIGDPPVLNSLMRRLTEYNEHGARKCVQDLETGEMMTIVDAMILNAQRVLSAEEFDRIINKLDGINTSSSSRAYALIKAIAEFKKAKEPTALEEVEEFINATPFID